MWLRCVCLLLVVLPCVAVPVAVGGEFRRSQQVDQRRPINRGPINRGAAALPLNRFAGKRRAAEPPRFDSSRAVEEQSLEPWEFGRLERPDQEPIDSHTSDWLVPQRRHLLPTGQGLEPDG